MGYLATGSAVTGCPSAQRTAAADATGHVATERIAASCAIARRRQPG
jgi:hypothetical protein